MNIKEILKHIEQYIACNGFYFEKGLVENFYLCIKTKPFVVLKGAHGCGKYSFVRLFCESLGINRENGRFKSVPIGGDMTSNQINDIISKFIQKAQEDIEKPYFLYLDNINMTNPEEYLSSLLFAMDIRNEAFKEDLSYPANLYLVGSFVSDYGAYPLSMRIKDRAHIIEMNAGDISVFAKRKSVQKPIDASNDFLKQKYISPIESEKEEYLKITISLFVEINKSLKFLHREISYRTINEIMIYLVLNKELELLCDAEAFDNVFMQRVITRIEGNQAYIKTILSIFFKICVPRGVGDYCSNSLKMFRALSYPDCRYPKSAEKLTYMAKEYEDKGYCSFDD